MKWAAERLSPARQGLKTFSKMRIAGNELKPKIKNHL
jgi:hypothetical protein